MKVLVDEEADPLNRYARQPVTTENIRRKEKKHLQHLFHFHHLLKVQHEVMMMMMMKEKDWS